MLFSQVYDKPYKLYEIKTRYFTIIFPEESKNSAQYLANFADAVYEIVAEKLGTQPDFSIPVVITPSSETINGYFSTMPFLKIVLYETSISKNTALSSNDTLYKLFYHELTHFVSLTALNPLMKTLCNVFGGWVYGINQIQIPLNFIEGVTVSFESHDGWGRATDPLPGGQIRQDIIENNFRTFVQSMGAWDKYPGRSIYYWYGGYFSLYLQTVYGQEKYAKLWRYFSNLINVTPLDDIGAIKGKFREIYGISLEEAWENFKDYMSIKVPVYMNVKKISQEANYSAMESDGKKLLLYDLYKNQVVAFNPHNKDIKTVFTHSQHVERISVHKGNGNILLSTYTGSSAFPKQTLEVYTNGKISVLPWKKISDACWAGDNILAIETEHYVRNLVLLAGNEKRLVLKGSESVIYWNPVSNDNGTVLYILVSEHGKTSIVRITMDHGAIKKLQKLKLNDSLTWIRYLSYSEGKLYASWDDDKLYRLLIINDSELSESAAIAYETVPITGGVHVPLAIENNIAYLGFFSQGKSICMFPENTAMSGIMEEDASWKDASYLMKITSVYDAPAETDIINKYHGARWLLPSGIAPYISYNFGNNTVASGVRLLLSDPTESYYAELSASWTNAFPEVVQAYMLIDFMFHPCMLEIAASDVFQDMVSTRYRLSNVVLALRSVFGNNDAFFLLLAGGIIGTSDVTETTTDYYRFWDIIDTGLSLQIGYNNTQKLFNEPSKYQGLSVSGLYRLDKIIMPEYPVYYTGLEGKLSLASGHPFIELLSEGAWSPNETLYYGPAGSAYLFDNQAYGGTSSLTVYPELTMNGLIGYSAWYIQNSLTVRLVTAELQRSFLGLYFNRIFINAGFRAAFSATPVWFTDVEPLTENFSAFISFHITGGTGFFSLAAAHVTAGLEIAMAYTNTPGIRLLVKVSM